MIRLARHSGPHLGDPGLDAGVGEVGHGLEEPHRPLALYAQGLLARGRLDPHGGGGVAAARRRRKRFTAE